MTTKNKERQEPIAHTQSTPMRGKDATVTKPKSCREADPANASTPPDSKLSLVKYATTNIGLLGDERTLTEPGIVEAMYVKAAEDFALRLHVPEGFSEEPPFAAMDDSGEWTTLGGFRAFGIGQDACDVDAGSILWIEVVQEVCAEDAAILKKYISGTPRSS